MAWQGHKWKILKIWIGKHFLLSKTIVLTFLRSRHYIPPRSFYTLAKEKFLQTPIKNPILNQQAKTLFPISISLRLTYLPTSKNKFWTKNLLKETCKWLYFIHSTKLWKVHHLLIYQELTSGLNMIFTSHIHKEIKHTAEPQNMMYTLQGKHK